jgi:hypothetical protein
MTHPCSTGLPNFNLSTVYPLLRPDARASPICRAASIYEGCLDKAWPTVLSCRRCPAAVGCDSGGSSVDLSSCIQNLNLVRLKLQRFVLHSIFSFAPMEFCMLIKWLQQFYLKMISYLDLQIQHISAIQTVRTDAVKIHH